jgi:hypothetical protein
MQPVRDHDRRTIREQCPEGALDLGFGFRVEVRRRLVEDDDRRVGEEGTSIEDFTVALKADFFDNCFLQTIPVL